MNKATTQTKYYQAGDSKLGLPALEEATLNNQSVADYAGMLRVRRPAGTRSERKWISRWIDSIPGMECDSFGNRHITIGTNPRVLWSCHTDTVHTEGGLQNLCVSDDGFITANKPSSCLGADDTNGCWLMREMILANRPGVYVFHRDEECGGKGAKHIALDEILLEGIDHAIALDRKGTTSVITHQWLGRCCSDEFANELAARLGSKWKKDSTGSYTDTAEYTGIVPECTNLSVAYWDQHCADESSHLPSLLLIRDRLIALDASTLPVVRDPIAELVDETAKSNRAYEDWSREYYGDDSYDESRYGRGHSYREDSWPAYDSELDRLERVIDAHPRAVASVLHSYGISSDVILEEAGYSVG